MTIENVLNDLEKTKLSQLAEDEVTLQALKKVFLFGVYHCGVLNPGDDADPQMNFALHLMATSRELPDAQIGAVLRGQMEGITQVQKGFTELAKFKSITITEPVKPKNKAR